MEAEIKTILQDEREIERLWIDGQDSLSHRVGNDSVEKIVAYGEKGGENPYHSASWFAVYVEGKIKYRVNAAFVEAVVYRESRE